MYGRRDRINERDVPESQHTIFIRGLPAAITTEEIRDFFAKTGSCSFDFVKVSPDRTKLYVAVRFDSKNAAREVMEKYSEDGNILGYNVELTWFRDIRRYLAHCAKQGVQPSRIRSGGNGGRYRGGRGRSRSFSISPDRGGGDAVASYDRSASHSPSRSRSASRSIRSRSLSKSAASSPRSTTHSQPKEEFSRYDNIQVKMERHESRSPKPPPVTKKSKKKKERKDRKRRRHQQQHYSPVPNEVGSDMEMDVSEGEIPSPTAFAGKTAAPVTNSGLQDQQQQQAGGLVTMTSTKMIGPNTPQEILAAQAAAQQQQAAAAQQQLTAAAQQQAVVALQHQPPMLHRHAPTSGYNIAALQQQQQPQPDSSSEYPARQVQQQQPPNAKKFRQTFTIDLDPNAINMPKFNSISASADAENIVAKQPAMVYQQTNGTQMKDEYGKRLRIESSSPPPTQQQPAATNARNSIMRTVSPLRESGPLASNIFKDIQRQILQDVRYKAQPENDEEDGGGVVGGLRLSSLSKQRMTEEMREEKMAKLSPELLERVSKKKRQLELSYRHDCETFGLVTRKLIEKDKTLEDRLKMALFETMKDLEAETFKQLDEFLEQLSFICG